MLVDIGNHLLLGLSIRIFMAGGHVFLNVAVFINDTPYFIKISQELKFMTAFGLLTAQTDLFKKLCQ